MTYQNKINGIDAEKTLIDMLNKEGICKHINTWFDILFNDTIKIEVKSCQLAVQNGDKYKRIGRFKFTDPYNLKLIRKEKDCYIAFFLRIRKDIHFLGIIEGYKIPNKQHITLTGLYNLQLMNLAEFIDKIYYEIKPTSI